MKAKRIGLGCGLIFLAVVLIGCLWGGWLIFHPAPLQVLLDEAGPDPSYAQAQVHLQRIAESEPEELNPDCRLIVLDHGQKTAKAIALIHGDTNCPRQFRELGQMFYQRGYNVVIASMPYHGMQDRMTTALSDLAAEDLITYGDNIVNLVNGLGERRVVAGFSGGANLTAWLAQNRGDLDQAVMISPLLDWEPYQSAVAALPESVNRQQLFFGLVDGLAGPAASLPDWYIWWNPQQKDADPLTAHAYPRYSLRSLIQFMRLGAATVGEAGSAAPKVKNLLVVTNAADPLVSNQGAEYLVKLWQSGGAQVQTDEFPADLNLPHDLIDVTQAGQRVDVVYPKLIEWIEGK